jgi:hypothetical protein
MGSVPVGRRKRAGVTDGPQTFRSPTGVIIWWVWLLFAAANLIDLAVQGRDHGSVVAVAILLLVTGVAYVCAQRPRLVADRLGITVLNPLRDHHAGWACVTKVDLYDLLRVHFQQGQDKPVIIHAWAVHYSRRRKISAEFKATRQSTRLASGRSQSGPFGLGGDTGRGRTAGSATPATGSAAEAEAERIVAVLQDYATAAQAEVVWAEGSTPAGAAGTARAASPGATSPEADAIGAEPGAADPRLASWLEPLRSSWNLRAILAVVGPALILLIVSLI